MEKKAYVYMIQCEDGSYYTGWTNNLEKRWKQHVAAKGAKYTRSHKPVDVVFVQQCLNQSEAMQKEAAIKKLSRLQKTQLILQTSNQKKTKIVKKESNNEIG